MLDSGKSDNDSPGGWFQPNKSDGGNAYYKAERERERERVVFNLHNQQ